MNSSVGLVINGLIWLIYTSQVYKPASLIVAGVNEYSDWYMLLPKSVASDVLDIMSLLNFHCTLTDSPSSVLTFDDNVMLHLNVINDDVVRSTVGCETVIVK